MESPYIVFYSLYLKCKGTHQEKKEIFDFNFEYIKESNKKIN